MRLQLASACLVCLVLGCWCSVGWAQEATVASSKGADGGGIIVRRRPAANTTAAAAADEASTENPAVPAGGSDDVLFTINIRLDPTGVVPPVKFVARKGDNILHKASELASELGLQPEDEAKLVEAARQYAQVNRVLPLKEMTFSLASGQDLALAVYEGDLVDDLKAQVREGGAADDAEANRIVASALMAMQEERLIPVVVSDVEVRGELTSVSIFKGDDVQAVVREFVRQHSLGPDDATALAEHMVDQAFKRRAIPMLLVPVTLDQATEGGEMQHWLEFWHGDSLGENVASFVAQHQVPEESHARLLAYATRQAARAGFVPFLKNWRPSRAPDGLPEIPAVWARDNLTEVVGAYAREHGLDNETAEDALREAQKAARAAGALPLLALTVNVEPTDGSGQAVPTEFRLFEGDELEAVVAKFAGQFNLTAPAREQLQAHVARLAQTERLLPTYRSEVEMHRPDGSPVTVGVTFFDGDNAEAVARAAAGAAELNETETAELVRGLVRSLQRERLLPAVQLNMQVKALSLVFEMYWGDDVDEAVQRFAREHSLDEESAGSLLGTARVQAMEKGMIPMLTLPVGVEIPGEPEPVQRSLSIFHGEDVREAVVGFAVENGLDDQSAQQLLDHVLAQSASRGVRALMELQLSIPSDSAEDARPLEGVLEVFQGDSPRHAAERFLLSAKREVSGPMMARLEEEVKAAGLERRVFPVIKFNLTAFLGAGSGLVELFMGDNVTEKVEALASAHGLSEESRQEMERQVMAQAVKARAVPVLVVPVDLEDGTSQVLNLFSGDNVTEVCSSWGLEHGLSAGAIRELTDLVTARAASSRAVALMSMDVDLGGGRGSAKLSLFEGDNITQAVRKFIASQGVDPGREQEMEAALFNVAVQQRLLPEHEVPVRVETPSGAVNEMFSLFRGEDVQEAARRFVEKHNLGGSHVADLLQLVRQKLPSLAGAGESPKDEL